MIRRIQFRIISSLPFGVQVYPLDATFALLGSISGVGVFIRLMTSPALSFSLPTWALYVWAALLTIGSIAWLVGILSVVRTDQGNAIVRNAPMMVLGLGLISVVTLVYGIAVIARNGWTGVLAAMAYFAISGGTYVRRWVIMNRLENHE